MQPYQKVPLTRVRLGSTGGKAVGNDIIFQRRTRHVGGIVRINHVVSCLERESGECRVYRDGVTGDGDTCTRGDGRFGGLVEEQALESGGCGAVGDSPVKIGVVDVEITDEIRGGLGNVGGFIGGEGVIIDPNRVGGGS